MTKEKSKRRTLFIICGAISCFLLISTLPWTVFDSPDRADETVVGRGSLSNLQKTYDRWAKAYSVAEPAGPVVTLSWTKGLSREFSQAKGIAQFNLEKGIVSVRIKGLEDSTASDVWLVDNQPGPGRSVLPEEGDRMVNLGSLKFDGNNAWLDGQIAELSDFKVDLVVVARRDGSPGRGGVLYGTTSLFQRMYHYPEQSRTSSEQETVAASLFINEAHAQGVTPEGFFKNVDSSLINKGRDLFFNETFNGNGRTCGTCHKEDDNMALGIKTIAALPDSDPLFIVEQEFRQDGSFNPLFNEFRMEKPALMRKLGLIVENLDGFIDETGDFTSKAVMRAPNHVLSVRTTLAPPPAQAFDDGTLPVDVADLVFAERTGWGGDGTPTGFRDDFDESNKRDLTGSLRDFTIGAIVQHFTLTLERSAFETEGGLPDGDPRQPDFRFATEEELDAMEAFMLSIGRQEENQDLNTLVLKDEVADRGRRNYMGFNVFDADQLDGRPPLNCNACHLNGGANTNPEFPFPPSVTPNHDLADLGAAGGEIPRHNRSFGPQVERLIDQAGDVIVQVVDDPSVTNPFDNGFAFGFDDEFADMRAADNRFNVPPVFEAMDNPPFFHGHQINTVEGSVAFYATNRHLRNGEFLPAIVPLNGAQVINVARFMRVMGADFNAESAITLLKKARQFRPNQKAYKRINMKLAIAEVIDAIELLEAAQLHFMDAVPLFEEARKILKKALPSANKHKLRMAIKKLKEAQDAMIDRNPSG